MLVRVGISGLLNSCKLLFGLRVPVDVFIDFSGINDRWNLLVSFVIRLSEKQQQQKYKKQIEAFVRTAEENLVWTVSHRHSGPSYG